MTDIVNDVLDIISAKASVDRAKLVPEAKLSDLSIASLDVVEIVFALEEKFDIQIPFNANAGSGSAAFQTVGDVVRAVESLIADKSAN